MVDEQEHRMPSEFYMVLGFLLIAAFCCMAIEGRETMKPLDAILIGPDSILLIHPPVDMEIGTLMQGVGRRERECYPFDGKLVQDKIMAEKTVREMRERKWL
jgi:hypothetical protein